MVMEGKSILEQLQRTRCSSENETAPTVATLNFIVFIDDSDHEAWVIERAARVGEKYPSRLILLDATDSSNEATVKCLGGSSAANVTSECVDLAVAALNAPAIKSLVEELSVPAIPSVLWWTSKQLSPHPVLDELLGTVSRLIVDSSGVVTDESILRELAAFHNAHAEPPLGDLAWMRLAPWQEMIAQFFDDEALLGLLSAPELLEIDSGSKAEGLYLAGWLGSRLQWTVRDADGFATSDGAPIRFVTNQRGEPRRVIRVAIEGQGSRCVAELSEDASVVKLTVTGPAERPEWFVPLQNISNLALLEQFINASTTDENFEAALRFASDFVDR